ncbi:pitrilysin family protein [Synechococcus sp. CBW1108]|uniref:M16 family metallopeptidase n=1 Tax=Synechococcus sp. CBW1108 TaxID=1353147 RepID=UPI0018CD54A9|nr:pitrilysin family protein [Synechococcus sp. CBW1108]QPN69567.1 insulinase family protein [Synechococcus sp. CBW1108]
MTSAPTAPQLPGLAEPTELQLANGATLVQLQLADSPLVCLDFWCRAGSIFEKAPESGLAHFLEHMVFKGSQRLGPGEFDLKIEAMGGSSNAATGFDDVHYHVLVPPESAAQALELLLDLVLHPSLEPRAFEMERQVVLEELAQSEDQPDEIALQQLLRLGCPGHAYGEPILGRRELLAAQTPEAMADFHRRLYGANRCVLALCGGADFLQLKEGIGASALAQLGAIDEPPPPPALAVQPGLHRITVPRLESARLLMLWGLPPASDLHGVMGADLLTTVLAEGRRSLLVERLREQLRIVESIDLDLHVMESGSFALLEAICEADELGAVHRAIAQVWAELQEQGLTKPEWLRAQRLVANGYRFGLEAAGGLAGLIGNNRLWGRHQALALPLAEIESWSSQELLDQVVPLLDPSRACVLEAVPA